MYNPANKTKDDFLQLKLTLPTYSTIVQIRQEGSTHLIFEVLQLVLVCSMGILYSFSQES